MFKVKQKKRGRPSKKTKDTIKVTEAILNTYTRKIEAAVLEVTVFKALYGFDLKFDFNGEDFIIESHEDAFKRMNK